MDLMEAMKSRRSVRSFKPDDVPGELLEKVIAGAMTAPSAGNQQPWHFIIIRDRQRLDEVPVFHPYCKMITGAPAAILVCGDPHGKKWPDFWVQDCSAAVQNLLLAARGEGLGTVWTGVFPDQIRVEGCRKLCGIPEHVIPFALVVIGWPGKDGFKEMERFRPELIHHEVFRHG